MGLEAAAPPAAAVDDDEDGDGDDGDEDGQLGRTMPGEHVGLGFGLVVGGLVVGGADVVCGGCDVDALVDGVDGASVDGGGAEVVGAGVWVGAGAPINCLVGNGRAGLPASHLSMNSCHALPGRSRPYSGAP